MVLAACFRSLNDSGSGKLLSMGLIAKSRRLASEEFATDGRKTTGIIHSLGTNSDLQDTHG